MTLPLAAWTTFLGKPGCHTLLASPRGTARVAAHWICGCVATGENFTTLRLTGCAAHRPRAVAEQAQRELVTAS